MSEPTEPTPEKSDKQLSPEEVLGGLGGRNLKQASALLFLIENRTAHLLLNSQQAITRSQGAQTGEAQAQAFLQALAQGRDLPVPPTIRNLERYAQQWAALIPDNPNLRAALAHLLGEKYTFPASTTPEIRTALALDSATVRQAYQQLYRQPLATIYSKQVSLPDRLRWGWARLAGQLENLSPFWSAFALTLTETVGAGILALPIALAHVGPLAGAIFLLVFGVVNILTLAGITEAITRNGHMRYGYAFFGQLVRDYLGQAGTMAFSLSLLLFSLLISTAYYVGITTALADAIGFSPMLWAALLFLTCLFFLRRQSLGATIASALVIGFVNLSLILILSSLAWPQLRLENLRYVNLPWLNGQPFDPTIFELVFGVVLAAYFGHTSVGNVAKVVLARDPGGRTLLRGNVSALIVAMILYIYWVMMINGAVSPAVLAETKGTVLGPLAVSAGPAVHFFGSIFAVLGMGMALIQHSFVLFNLVQEWLPMPVLAKGDKSSTDTPTRHGSRIGQRARMWLGILPALLIFAVTEWLLWSEQASFAAPLSLICALVVPLLAGIFPVLLLAVSRRKGEYIPATVWRWLGHPVILTLIYLIFFSGLLVHGLVIWPDPVRRVAALLVCASILLLTWFALRRRALAPRTVVEVRLDQQVAGRAFFQIVNAGKPLVAALDIIYRNRQQTLNAATGEVANFPNVRSLRFHLPTLRQVGELKIWLHQLSAAGDSSGLPARCMVHKQGEQHEYTISNRQSEIVLATNGEAQQVEVMFT